MKRAEPPRTGTQNQTSKPLLYHTRPPRECVTIVSCEERQTNYTPYLPHLSPRLTDRCDDAVQPSWLGLTSRFRGADGDDDHGEPSVVKRRPVRLPDQDDLSPRPRGPGKIAI